MRLKSLYIVGLVTLVAWIVLSYLLIPQIEVEHVAPAVLARTTPDEAGCAMRYAGVDLAALSGMISSRNERYFFAANLHNNEDIVAGWLTQLTTAIVWLFPSIADRQRIFVSIYDSASDDSTPEMLRLAEIVFEQMGVPHRVVYNGSITAEEQVRETNNYNRIGLLARLRNELMKPFYGLPKFDRVVFINDIVFCAEDILWLILSNSSSSDMVCSTDFWRPNGRIDLYDTWVTRDIAGQTLFPEYPGFVHAASKRLLLQGEIVPVQCCWNGMVSINAEVFYSGIRFRDNGYVRHKTDGDGNAVFVPELWHCSASEMTQLCGDMWKGGFNRIGMDTFVQVAYDLDVYRGLSASAWHQPRQRGMDVRLKDLKELDEAAATSKKLPWSHVVPINVSTAWMLPSALNQMQRVLKRLSTNAAVALDAWNAEPQPGNNVWGCCDNTVRPPTPSQWCCSIYHPSSDPAEMRWQTGDPLMCGWQEYGLVEN